MEKYWKEIALGKLGELKNRAHEIKSADEIYTVVNQLGIPQGLKKGLIAEPISLGIILPPLAMG